MMTVVDWLGALLDLLTKAWPGAYGTLTRVELPMLLPSPVHPGV